MLFESNLDYASKEFNVATDEKGTIYISYRTCENVFCLRKNSTREKLESNRLKALLPKGSQLGKFKSNTDKCNSVKSWLTLSEFTAFVAFLASEGNQHALALMVAGFVTDFASVANSHFGRQLDDTEREYIRTLVFNRIATFKAWTTVIRDRHIALFGDKPTGAYYRDCVVHVNEELFGVPHFKCDRGNMTELQQKTIHRFEDMLVAAANKFPSLDPKSVIEKALEVYHLIY